MGCLVSKTDKSDLKALIKYTILGGTWSDMVYQTVGQEHLLTSKDWSDLLQTAITNNNLVAIKFILTCTFAIPYECITLAYNKDLEIFKLLMKSIHEKDKRFYRDFKEALKDSKNKTSSDITCFNDYKYRYEKLKQIDLELKSHMMPGGCLRYIIEDEYSEYLDAHSFFSYEIAEIVEDKAA